MKIVALIIAIFGTLILGFLMLNLKVVEVDSLQGLEKLEINTKVELEGKVIEERIIRNDFRIMKIGDLEIVCECLESFKGKEIRAVGMVEEFNGKRQVRALRIEEL